MFISDVSEPYETLKQSILKRRDLTDRQMLDQLLNYIDQQHSSSTDMLQMMREVIGQRTFDDSLSQQLFLSRFPQQVQAVLVSSQHNTLDELAESADRILKIAKSSNSEVFQSKNCLKRPKRSTSRKRSVSRPRETDNPDWCSHHNQYRKSSRNSREPCNFLNSKSTYTKKNSGNVQAVTC
ncbi:unnamed protein product [Schistosoma margrebowiei]|uniref:Uncharacterized protein n=1 Tax=Schistosoma margrebowiei TaxID=48269 RepID=A0A183MPR3_9TREM|nr:unnamed protein product [Schistosoma margrebowiei]